MAHIAYHYKLRRVVLSALSRKLKAKGVRGGSKSNISRIFNGQRDPSYRLLKEMAEVRGIDLEEMSKMLEHCRKQYADFHSCHIHICGRRCESRSCSLLPWNL